MKKIILLAALYASTLSAEPSLDFKFQTPAEGKAPLTVKFEWNAPDSTGCIASEGWTGGKAATGVSNERVLNETTTFTITCKWLSTETNAILSWDPVTTYTDGSPLTSLGGYRIFKSDQSATLGLSTPIQVSKDILTYTFENLTGTNYFAVKSFDIENLESGYSNVVSKTIGEKTLTASITAIIKEDEPVPPSAPVLRVSEPTAYTIVKRPNAFVLLPVGTIPLGTTCMEEQSVNGYYAVPRELVVWSGSIKPDVVVAQCSKAS